MIEQRSSNRTADALIDELLPDDFAWRDKVRAYPVPALMLAGLTGFALGRSRGDLLLGALSTFAVGQVADNLSRVFNGENDPVENDPVRNDPIRNDPIEDEA